MKTLPHICIVFVILSVIPATSLYAQASQAAEQADVAKLQAETARRVAVAKVETAREASEVRLTQAKLAREQSELALRDLEAKLQAARLPLVGSAYGYQPGQEDVLIVPRANADPNALTEISEDLNIMCRIFHRKLQEADLAPKRRVSYFTVEASKIDALYLDGYGPLFTLAVNFPLSPPAKAGADQEETSAVDPLWQQMQLETRQPSGLAPMYGMHGETEQMEYEQEKIQQLKDTLLAALKYATNVRNLGDKEIVTVVVKGRQATEKRENRSDTESTDPTVVVSRGLAASGVDPYIGFINLHRGGSWASTALTIRAKKSDIDSFAKDKLTLKQFAEKVEMFSSYMGGPDHTDWPMQNPIF